MFQPTVWPATSAWHSALARAALLPPERARFARPNRQVWMMTSETTLRLIALCFDANDPHPLARFWADALHWDIDDETPDKIGLAPTDDTRFRIEFQAVPEHKVGKNRIHLDLTTTSIDDQKEMVGRLVELGARHIDI